MCVSLFIYIECANKILTKTRSTFLVVLMMGTVIFLQFCNCKIAGFFVVMNDHLFHCKIEIVAESFPLQLRAKVF